MTVRVATSEDVSAIVDMGREFHAYSPWRDVEFDADAVSVFVERLIDGGVIFISETGMIGGVINPLYFNPAHSVAAELFWWAKSGGRELMARFEEWAVEQGASGIQFSALGDSQSDRMDRLFIRAGYSKVETGYYRGV